MISTISNTGRVFLTALKPFNVISSFSNSTGRLGVEEAGAGGATEVVAEGACVPVRLVVEEPFGALPLLAAGVRGGALDMDERKKRLAEKRCRLHKKKSPVTSKCAFFL